MNQFSNRYAVHNITLPQPCPTRSMSPPQKKFTVYFKSINLGIRKIAMEFIPTTLSGKAHFLYPLTSIIQ